MAGRSNIGLRTALRAEALVARLFGRNRVPRVIEPFAGYATAEHLIVQGRVHSKLNRHDARFDQGRVTNFRQMLGMFLTSEVPGARVIVGGIETRTDEEGYFRVALPRGEETGWLVREATLAATGDVVPCPVYVPAKGTAPVVISDIDDTVMETGAYSLLRNLWTSLTGNALTRQVFADTAILLHRLHHEAGCPVYYVSSSPWNIYYFLDQVFVRNGVVRGAMFLRDLGLDEGKFITAGHGNHKGDAIDTILGANPGRAAILIGDTGQTDAESILNVGISLNASSSSR